MGKRFKVELIASDGDLSRFHALLCKPQTTVDIAHAWLVRRGYQISRNAVGNYKREHGQLVPLFRIAGDGDARRKLADWSKRLSGKDLRAVASLAGILAGIGSTKREAFKRSNNPV